MGAGPRRTLPGAGRRGKPLSGRAGIKMDAPDMSASPPVKTEDFVFSAGEHWLAATRVQPDAGAASSVLTLHGLGQTANRHTIRYVLDHLAGHGLGSVCFEFSGNGDSSGALEEACLRRRYEETLAAAEHLDKREPLTLIGTSMGGHLAAWVAPVLKPACLVLFCPASYPADAAESRFDGGLARPGPYPDSPAYAGLREFSGDLLIIGAGKDAVVPAETLDGYLAAAMNARSKKMVWLDDCEHFIHRWLPHQDALRPQVLTTIRDTILRARARQ